VIAAAHRCGSTVLIDVYHSAGVIPIDIAAMDADFAVGGGYKYLRGGPGACWLYLHPRHLDGSLTTLDAGWFAKREPFAYRRTEAPEFAAGGNAFLESTPPILTYYQAGAGLEFTLAMGVERLRAYSLEQQKTLLGALAGYSVRGGHPAHGAFVVVEHERAAQLAERLRKCDVIVDARGRWLRLCPDVLNTSDELARAASAVRTALEDATPD
jgi:kynureninase